MSIFSKSFKTIYNVKTILILIPGIILIGLFLSEISKNIFPGDDSILFSVREQNAINQINNLNKDDTIFHFNGLDDYLIYDDQFRIDSDFSINFSINIAEGEKDQTLILKGEKCPDGNPNYNGTSFQISIDDKNRLDAIIFSDGGNHTNEYISLKSIENIIPDKWYKISLIFDNTNKKLDLYINGLLSPSIVTPKTNLSKFSRIHNSESFLKIGVTESYCGRIHHFNSYYAGELSDLIIYNIGLSKGQISRLHGKGIVVPNGWINYGLIIWMLVLIIYLKRPNYLNLQEGSITSRVVFSIILCYFYFMIASNRSEYSNVAYFGGDTWEYQSMAVNLLKGHGPQRFGGMEKFDTYKFHSEDPELAKAFNAEAGEVDTYRTPLYPIFLAGVYYFFGINPIYAKLVQLFLFVLIASFLPWIGESYWGIRGFISGLIAGIIFLFIYDSKAGQLLTEPLFSFFIFILVIVNIWYEKSNSLYAIATLGAICGFTLLIRGSLIFYPMIIVTFFSFQSRILSSVWVKKVTIFLLPLIIVILPWSLYATHNSESLVILSTQSQAVILDGNNEYAIDGSWHPEWKTNPNSFYNQYDWQSKSTPWLISKFYINNPSLILSIFPKKIFTGYNGFIYLFTSALIILSIFLIRLQVVKSSSLLKTYVTSLTIVIVVLLITVLRFRPYYFTVYEPIVFILTILPVVTLFVKTRLNIPRSFIFLHINFLLITLLIFGHSRFIEVMDFVFILCGVYFTLEYIGIINDYLNQNIQKKYSTYDDLNDSK